MKSYVLLSLGLLVSGAVFAGVEHFKDAKLHCVFLKNGKVVKQQNCTADGHMRSSVAYGDEGYAFHAIKGYGKIKVENGYSLLMDKMDQNGESEFETYALLNGKPAIMRWRTPKTFKLATQKQIESDDDNTLYTCYSHEKNAKYEFCYLLK